MRSIDADELMELYDGCDGLSVPIAVLAICDSIERKVNDAMPGPINSLCGIPLDEAMKVLTIYKYTNEREIGPAFAEGFAEGYNAAVDEMNKKLKESLDAVFKPIE